MTELWYGYWKPDEDNVKYYELRFYPDHSTSVSDGSLFAEKIRNLKEKTPCGKQDYLTEK